MLARRGLLIAGLIAVVVAPAAAQEKISVAIGQRTVWDSMIVPIGVEAGVFKKHGLDVSITFTAGGAETLQAMLTGSTDYALTNGVEGVLSAYEKGAPIRIVSSQSAGAGDIFWYVKGDSPIKTMKDAEGKTMAFSRPGSSSHLVAQQLARKYGVNAKLVSTGAMPATRTQVMSGQIDIGWAAPPFGLDAAATGEVRVLITGGDLAELKEVSVRVNVTTAKFLETRRAAALAFNRAYKESLDWMYANPDKAAAHYARENKVSPEIARAGIAFYSKASMEPWPVRGLEFSVAEAVKAKRLTKPLTAEQLKELVVEVK